MNTWPGGQRRPLTQAAHEAWNAQHYPGTRQMCVECDEPTGRADELTSLYADNGYGPLCEECYAEVQRVLDQC